MDILAYLLRDFKQSFGEKTDGTYPSGQLRRFAAATRAAF
jgi:hypothetical protein